MVKQRDRKVGLSHYINPRPESIASRQTNQVVFNLSIKIVYNLSFQSDSDDAFMSAISSRPSTRGQQKTTSSRMLTNKKRRRWDNVSLFVTKNNNFQYKGRGRQSHNWSKPLRH